MHDIFAYPNRVSSRTGHINRKKLKSFVVSLCAVTAFVCAVDGAAQNNVRARPNILFALADDWSWPHASAYGAPEVNTPNFDRVAKSGWLMRNVFTAAPQCSPNRAACLTGRNIWQIAEAGTHASIFPTTYPAFTDLLDAAGYHVGYTGKGWGPGDWRRGGWPRNPAGQEFAGASLTPPASGMREIDYPANFKTFLDERPDEAPFFFWFGAGEPHRSYEAGSGIRAGKRPENVEVPGFLPDHPVVREDLLDYYVEIEWFDRQLGRMLEFLEEAGELDNTFVIVSGDNGMPFPRAKANVYEYGVHVPMAVQWPKGFAAEGATDHLISFIDIAPTVLEAAGVAIPASMTGGSFLSQLKSSNAPGREFALFGRERHTHARYDNWGYPSRAIRTPDFLYIRNFKPDRWPAGDPDKYHDIDGSPSKTLVVNTLGPEDRYFELAVGKRPLEELFDIRSDPACLDNLADQAAHATTRAALEKQLLNVLTAQKDPRALGTGDVFESYPRVSGMRPELGGFAERGEYNPDYAP